jgi:hypothetical protein
MRRLRRSRSRSLLPDFRRSVRPGFHVSSRVQMRKEMDGERGEEVNTYAVFEDTLGAPVQSILRTGSIPSDSSDAMLTAVEICGC